LHGAVIGGDPDALDGLILPACHAGQERVSIYRHHYLESIADALAEVYPVTRALVGEDFFRQVALVHVRENPPTDPRLSEYGRAFDCTLERAPGCDDYGYLSDVARLEWAVHQAACAPREAALDASAACEALGHRGPVARFRFIAAMQLFCSQWPVDEIWRVHQRAALRSDLRLERQRAWLLIARDEGGTYVRSLDPAAFCLRVQLERGTTLAEAVETMHVAHPEADSSSILGELLGDQTIAEIR
jgi:hypothetical protein